MLRDNDPLFLQARSPKTVGSVFAATQFEQSPSYLSQSVEKQYTLIHLVELCHLEVRPNHLSEKTKGVALTLFHLATIESNIKLRAIGQKNAAACLSHVDPVAAMELLFNVKFQRPEPGEWLYEDPRYNAAETTFVNFVKLKPLDIASIAIGARYLGETGQYPYAAIARVIRNLSASQKREARILLSDALTFYINEIGFYNRDEEFLRLLKSLPNSLVDKQLAARAVAIFALRLQNSPIHIPGDYYAEIQIDSNGKIFSFTDRNAAFLFQAFPTIRHFNPRLAAQLSQCDPRLTQAMDKMSYISGGFVQENQTSEQTALRHLEWLQDSLINQIQRIKECQMCDPQPAIHLALRLADLNLQLVGFSAVDGKHLIER